MSLSNRVQSIHPSPTLEVNARAAELRTEGKDIISLGVGEPDFDTPEHIKAAAKNAIAQGQTKYTAVGGTPELKQAVIDKFKRDQQLDYQPLQVLISCGGKQSFFNLALALLNSGDEVIIPAPYWVSYPDMVTIAEGTPVIVSGGIEQSFKITAAQLDAAITSRTKLVVINSPSNPSGQTYNTKELKALAEVLLRYPHVMIASDDMYEHVLWRDEPFCNILTVCPEMYDRTILLNGVSKAYAMTGWRIGYAAGPEWLISAMNKVQSQSTSNPCSIAQAAAVAALNGDQACVQAMVTVFKARHDYVVSRLRQIPQVKVIPSDGTFYIFADFSASIVRLNLASDIELANYLLEKGVALVAGSAFGMPNCLRLSFAASDEILATALDRITEALTESFKAEH